MATVGIRGFFGGHVGLKELRCCGVKDYCSATQIEEAQQLQQQWDAQVQASATSSSQTQLT